MGSDLNICANIIRVILVIINILFVILGCILIGIGSWGIAIDRDFSFVTGSSIASGAALIIFAGCVTVVICVTGILGAIFKWRPMLVIYASILIVIVILEIVGGILAFIFSVAVLGGLEGGTLRAISLYPASVDSNLTTSSQRDAMAAVDALQNTLSCCGYNNATDWPRENPTYLQENNGAIPQEGGCRACTEGVDDCVRFTGTFNVSIPNSNMVVPTPYNFTASREGCIDGLRGSLVVIGVTGGAVGVVFGIFEITGILFAFFLCCCINSARRQEVV